MFNIDRETFLIAHQTWSKIPHLARVYFPVTLVNFNPTEVIADSVSVFDCDVGRGKTIFKSLRKKAKKFLVNAQNGACDLSNEKASAGFFVPPFLHRHCSVCQSPIHVSPDVNRWVVAYAMPVVAENKKKAILHYESDLDILQRVQTKVSSRINSA